MKAVVTNLFTRGSELKTLDGLDYTGYYHITNSGSAMSESTYVAGVSKPLIFYSSAPKNAAGDIISIYNEETETYDGVYTVIPVKNYKNDIDLPEETIILADPSPVTVVEQPELFFKKNTTDASLPGLELFIDESNVIRAARGTKITLQFGYRSDDIPENIIFQWFDSFDRVVSTNPRFELNVDDIDGEEESFYCTITDSFGSDTTNEITVSVVDPANNPYIFTNIVQNGYATEGTANWDSVGESPEDTGKFLAEFETVEVPDFIFGLNAGTYFYHKFISGSDSKLNKNQWYPRPEEFDARNNFGGTIVEELKDDYFRAGSFSPVVRDGDNDHKGTIKSSTQIIDLTDFGDGLDGKIYGIKGFYAVMFGWLGGRADQADRVSCEMEFLDENDEVIPVSGKTLIEDADWYQRTVNEYRRLNAPPKVSPIHAGLKKTERTGDPILDYRYTGLYKDGNNGINFNRYQIESQLADGSIRIVAPVVKTLILGRTTDMIQVPPVTRKIRVIKRYYHVPGVVDLIWEGKEWQEKGNEYVSDALVAGLNVRLYPILVDPQSGNELNTGFDESGRSVIKFMNFLEERAADEDLAELGLVTNGSEFGTQYYDNQELQFDPVTPVKIINVGPATPMFYYYSGFNNSYDKRVNVNSLDALGANWGAYLNDAMIDFIEGAWGDPPDDPNRSIDFKINYAAGTGFGKVYTNVPYLLPIQGVSNKGVKMEEVVKWNENSRIYVYNV
jgi:hypothetical protein